MKTIGSTSISNTTDRMIAKASERINKNKLLIPYSDYFNSSSITYSRTPTTQSLYKDNLCEAPKESCGDLLKVNELPDIYKFYGALPYYNSKVAEALNKLKHACRQVTSDTLVVNCLS